MKHIASSPFPNLYYASHQQILEISPERVLRSHGRHFVSDMFIESAHSSGMHILNENARLLRSHHSFLRNSNLRNVVQPGDSYDFLRSSFRFAGPTGSIIVRELPPPDAGQVEDEDLVVVQRVPERHSSPQKNRRSILKQVRNGIT